MKACQHWVPPFPFCPPPPSPLLLKKKALVQWPMSYVQCKGGGGDAIRIFRIFPHFDRIFWSIGSVLIVVFMLVPIPVVRVELNVPCIRAPFVQFQGDNLCCR